MNGISPAIPVARSAALNHSRRKYPSARDSVARETIGTNNEQLSTLRRIFLAPIVAGFQPAFVEL